MVTFEEVTRERRENCHRVARRYAALLRLQLDVGQGEKPRSVQKLVALGLMVVKGGRYRGAGQEHGKGSG